MNEERLPELGKIPPAFFDRVIYPRLGAKDANIVIGPKHGVDYGVVRVGNRYLAMSTDPFFIVPSFGFSKAAWFGFHIIFCDVAVSGLNVRVAPPASIAVGMVSQRGTTLRSRARSTTFPIRIGPAMAVQRRSWFPAGTLNGRRTIRTSVGTAACALLFLEQAD